MHEGDEGVVGDDGSTQLGALITVGLGVRNGHVRCCYNVSYARLPWGLFG
jgi:hypothetical protein